MAWQLLDSRIVTFTPTHDPLNFSAESVASNMDKTSYKISSLKHIAVQRQWTSATAYRVLEHYYGLYGHILLVSGLAVVSLAAPVT